MIQVHLADDDPISALEDAMAVLKNHPDDFTTLCIKVTLWETSTHKFLWPTLDHFQARCFFFLGQFEKSLLVWTQANRIRTNNKEVTKAITYISGHVEKRVNQTWFGNVYFR